MVQFMAQKGVLKKNFYFKTGGTIQFRQMIRGDLIVGSTGLTDPHKVNKRATEIQHKIISEYYRLKKEDRKNPHYPSLITKWLDENKSRWNAATYKTYKSNVYYYYHNKLPKKCSISRVNAVRRDWNIFARWCIKNGYDIKPLKGKTNSEGRIRVLSNGEIRRIFAVLRPFTFKCAVMFAYYTGARLKEINAPNIKKLHRSEDKCYLKVIKKGGAERIIKINGQAQDILEQCNWKFWNYSKSHLSKYYKQFAVEAGVEDTQFHDLRRTFGWNLIKQGVPIYQVSKLLGHKSVLTTERHYAPLLVTEVEEFSL